MRTHVSFGKGAFDGSQNVFSNAILLQYRYVCHWCWYKEYFNALWYFNKGNWHNVQKWKTICLVYLYFRIWSSNNSVRVLFPEFWQCVIVLLLAIAIVLLSGTYWMIGLKTNSMGSCPQSRIICYKPVFFHIRVYRSITYCCVIPHYCITVVYSVEVRCCEWCTWIDWCLYIDRDNHDYYSEWETAKLMKWNKLNRHCFFLEFSYAR